MGPFLLENQLCLFRPFVCNSAEKGSVFHTFPIKNGMISRFLLIIPQRPVRESNPHLVLRRAPTYCHSLSIWGKVNPYGTLYKTVSDSIWVILNTPSVKLWKLADCLLQLIIGECLDITIDICYMTTMLRTFDHGKQYSIKLPIESTRYFLVYK